MEPLFEIPEDFAALSDEDLQAFIEAADETLRSIGDAPENYVGEGRSKDDLIAEMREGRNALRDAKAALAARAESEEGDGEEEDEPAGDEPEGEAAAQSDEDFRAEVAALASESEEEEGSDVDEGDAAEGGDEEEAVVASAPEKKPSKALVRPHRSVAATPVQDTQSKVPLTASAGGLGHDIGTDLDRMDFAKLTIKARERFGRIPPGTKGEKVALAQYDYRDMYPEERTLTASADDQEKIDAVLNPDAIKQTFKERREMAMEAGPDADPLLASGGLCAPVTPYYNLMMVADSMRPVKAALPAFNADRGGINAARPLSLSAITTAVGVKTVANDFAGGTEATKTCQVISCPPFVETDVQIVYHCVQFGNLGSRTFPERVAQANDLVQAAWAQTAEAQLLTNIGSASTQVAAASLGLGIVGDLLGQILVAAAGQRNRHRMAPDTTLRALFPAWVLDALVSDTIRTQFGRFDMTQAQFVSLIRAMNVEPSFYVDSGAGAGQLFGPQVTNTPLQPFPHSVVWYLFPEGSFLYLDGGTLELGIVRDSVLNATNDFQIFGEGFENVAYVGVESLEIVSTVCDSGAVSLPHTVNCPLLYGS